VPNVWSRFRLFGQPKEAVRVKFFRDNHAWCPYCEKCFLFFEAKRIPYEVVKITMFCYGEKEPSYKKIVPSGMLPAIMLDGKLITESDDILWTLEQQYGPLGASMNDIIELRRLERTLFSAWCRWLCYPNAATEDKAAEQRFTKVVELVEQALAAHNGPFFLGKEFSVADVIFIPYVERMNASLFYYKGYSLRSENNPNVSRWFEALETRSEYRGIVSDFSTHVHDLPPQMGGCYANESAKALANQRLVDHGPFLNVPDIGFAEENEETSKLEALAAMLRFREVLCKVNPEQKVCSEAIRCALSYMLAASEEEKKQVVPPKGSDVALRYIRGRINCPRDMSIWAARRLKIALEETAALAGDAQAAPIPTRHRRDQDPRPFGKNDIKL